MTDALNLGTSTEPFETSHDIDFPSATLAERVSPRSAWHLFSTGSAVLVDVRTNEERIFVGFVPESTHVPWASGTSLTRNPRFVRELEARAGKHAPLLLLCRSGARAQAAAQAARAAGFTQVAVIDEGFEGELDERQQRGGRGGWRASGLPWVQS